MTTNYIDREIEIYKAFLDSSESLVSSPLLIFNGRLNNPSIKEDVDNGTSTLSFTASSLFVDFDKINARFTNNESQQSFFVGDTGMRYSSVIVKELNWGMTTGATQSGGGSSSVSTQGITTSPINNTAPSEKSIFSEFRPTNPVFSLLNVSGTIRIHIDFANSSTTNFSVGDQVEINGFESVTFDDGTGMSVTNSGRLITFTNTAPNVSTNLSTSTSTTSVTVNSSDGTNATVEQMSKDVTTFLMWAAEPHLESRHQMGFKAIIYLIILTILVYLSMKKIWSRVETEV